MAFLLAFAIHLLAFASDNRLLVCKAQATRTGHPCVLAAPVDSTHALTGEIRVDAPGELAVIMPMDVVQEFNYTGKSLQIEAIDPRRGIILHVAMLAPGEPGGFDVREKSQFFAAAASIDDCLEVDVLEHFG